MTGLAGVPGCVSVRTGSLSIGVEGGGLSSPVSMLCSWGVEICECEGPPVLGSLGSESPTPSFVLNSWPSSCFVLPLLFFIFLFLLPYWDSTLLVLNAFLFMVVMGKKESAFLPLSSSLAVSLRMGVGGCEDCSLASVVSACDFFWHFTGGFFDLN